MPAISHVGLSRDGTRAFAVDTPDIASEWQQRVHVEVAGAVQRPVEASTQEWQAASRQVEQQREQQQMQQQAGPALRGRSEEHTSELQSLMRISYAVFCLQKKNKRKG